MGKHKRCGFSKDEFIKLLNLAKELKSLQKKTRNKTKTNIEHLISNFVNPPNSQMKSWREARMEREKPPL